MDNSTHTSQRIRSILRAMDQSIDDARRRRSGDPPPPVPAAGRMTSATAPAAQPAQTPAKPAPPANPGPAHSASQPVPQPIRPEHNHTIARASATQEGEADSPQPQRLKARPKRWLSASA